MGELINLNAKVPLTDADIPSLIARDTETVAAVAAHAASADPHPIYLSQAEGDGRYRQSAVPLTDADIPSLIARDTETAAAVAAHVAATDPHPSLWSRIAATFARLTGGQQWLRNNPAITGASFAAPNNHLELATNNGSNPILGFHRGGASGTALYHAGYGTDSLRIRNADGYDAELLHRVNHLDIADPHPMYLTQAEGDARYGAQLRSTIFTGVMPTAAGHSSSFAHGIPLTGIRGFTCMVQTSDGIWVLPGGFPFPGYQYHVSVFQTICNVRLGGSDNALVVGRPYVVTIFHV